MREGKGSMMMLPLCCSALVVAAAASSAAVPTALQALIDAAVARGEPSLTLPPGSTYQQGAAPLLIGATDFLLDAAGARIVFAPGAGVVIERATRVEVRNLSVHYDPPSFTQGAVVATDPAAHTVDVRLDAGFATPDAAFFTTVEIKLQFYDASTRARSRPQSGSCIVTVVGAISPGVWRVRTAPGFTCIVPPLAAGVLATISPRVNGPDYQIPGGYVGGAWWVFNSTAVTTRAVALYGSGNFAFSEWGGGGGHVYEGIVLDREPGHLLSSNTDGFHSFAVGAGPTLRGARLAWMGDDVANFHNRVGLVLSTGGGSGGGGGLTAAIIDVGDTPTPRLDPANPARALAFAVPGDVLKITAPDGTPRGGAPGGAFTLAAAGLVWDTAPAVIAAARAAVAARPGVAVDPRGIGVWAATFTAAGADVVPGDIVQFDRFAGLGATVTDGVFTDAYDSCFRLQSSGARLANNTWARIPGGISVGYDPAWLEGASDIAGIGIDGNTFRAVLFPPATSMGQILSVSGGAVNVTQAGNTVLPV